MAIRETKNPRHWNYFLALEADLEVLARYVEFTKSNFKCHSIEIARLLLSASSEVDVIAKQISRLVDANCSATTMDAYRPVLRAAFPKIEMIPVTIARFGLETRPWENWSTDTTPYWWKDHNLVKHRRHECYEKANLMNALNAVGGLFILTLYLYRDEAGLVDLAPAPRLLSLGDEYVAGVSVGIHPPSVCYEV